MALIVQKFGGTSIANVDRIKSVALRVIAEVEQGNQVVVVVSAMAGVTNQLVGWSHQCINHRLTASEYDVVVSSGEQVTCGLMALALNDMGMSARSWLGWQIPIHTNDHHKNATIIKLEKEELFKSLAKGEVAVVAGFQGKSLENRLTTLGRGGSDYTAVALATELGAERCDIYTDVDGIFTADPRAVTNARHLKTISFVDVLDLAKNGSKVIQPQALAAAEGKNINIQVLSSFNYNEGTQIRADLPASDGLIGVANRRDLSMFTFKMASPYQDLYAQLESILYDGFIDVDEFYITEENELNLLVARDDYEETEAIVNQFIKLHTDRIEKIATFSRVAKVVVVGNVAKYAEVLIKKTEDLCLLSEIDIYQIKTTPRSMGLIISPDRMEDTVKILHENFILQQISIREVA